MKMYYVLFSDGNSVVCSDTSEINGNDVIILEIDNYDSHYIYQFNGKTLDKIKRTELIENRRVPESIQQVINAI